MAGRVLPIVYLPTAPSAYSLQDQNQLRRAIEQHYHPGPERLAGDSVAALTDGATITWNFAGLLDGIATVTLAGNRTLAFSNIAAGCRGTIIVKQDATGGWTLTLPAGSLVVGGGAGAVTLTAAANAVDVLTFLYDGTNYFWDVGLNYT